jgi:peptidoglycan/LPS O-acetylase OafA/YrhL
LALAPLPMPQKIPQFDAVRGIAILLVLIHDTNAFPSLHLEAISTCGWMGVDLFFVLFGFFDHRNLAASQAVQILLQEFLRAPLPQVWPLYYSLLMFMFLIVPYLHPSDAHDIFERSSP